MDVIILIV